jgi:TRAP-type C4-dicarboxylate transport system permease small subunit
VINKNNIFTQFQSFIGRLGRGVEFIEDTLLVLILIMMIVLASSQIALRNIWDSGIAWGDPLLRLSVLWVGLLGAMAATREDNHITIDVFYRYMPNTAKIIIRAITDLFAAAVCAIVAYYSIGLIIIEKQESSIAFAGIPAWITELIIPIGFGVMALRFLVRVFQRLCNKQT